MCCLQWLFAKRTVSDHKNDDDDALPVVTTGRPVITTQGESIVLHFDGNLADSSPCENLLLDVAPQVVVFRNGRHLTTTRVQEIGRILSTTTRLHTLCLNGFKGDDDDDKLALLLESGVLARLEKAHFLFCRLQEATREHISEALIHPASRIKELMFSSCDWNEVKEILKKGLGNVQKLILITRFDVPSLQEILGDSKVQQLHLPFNSWLGGSSTSETMLIALAKCIQSTPSIRSIDLTTCRISHTGAVALAEHLFGAGNKHVSCVDLRYNPLWPPSFDAILNRGLAGDTKIQRLAVCSAAMAPEAAAAAGLLRNSSNYAQDRFVAPMSYWTASFNIDEERRKWPFALEQVAKHRACGPL